MMMSKAMTMMNQLAAKIPNKTNMIVATEYNG